MTINETQKAGISNELRTRIAHVKIVKKICQLINHINAAFKYTRVGEDIRVVPLIEY